MARESTCFIRYRFCPSALTSKGEKGDKFYIILQGEVIGSLEPNFDIEQYVASFVEQDLFKL